VDAEAKGQMTQGIVPQGKPPAEALTKDAIYIAVVLHPDPSWTRVGTLAKTGN
jgi:hypothetical protein